MKNINKKELHQLFINIKQNKDNFKEFYERSNNLVTTQMYCQREVDRLKKYFHFYINKKPNVKTIINTVINKIEMKGD